MNCFLLLCNRFNDGLTYFSIFSFKCWDSVVLYIILLEVARELPRF